MDIRGIFWSIDPKRLYTQIKIPHIQNPNRLYAFPILGFLVKIIALVPLALWLAILSLVNFFVTIINSFIVLFTGKYWQVAYDLGLGIIRLTTRASYYVYGLTDKYPGFSLNNSGDVTVDIPFPQNPNRLYAVPVIGGLIRVVLLIPYFIWQQVLSYGAYLAVVIASFPVLFQGRYPETNFEIERDSLRVNSGSAAYTLGFSDTYPSLYISMNHQTWKVVYLILGALIFLSNMSQNFQKSSNQ